jgi:ectoine hydroxylase-related dioxygenase (phytanoyl-CoA dioxygenase family)
MSATNSATRTTMLVSPFTDLGVAVVEHASTPADLTYLDAVFPRLPPRAAGARASDFSQAAQDWLGTHEGLLDLGRRLTGASMRLSRLQAFNKSSSANWFVPWHQDRAEDGRDREIAILERTVALRIHLDDCCEDDGPLEVVPGSHRQGRLEAAAIAEQVAGTSPLMCLAARGDIVAIRPLLLHRSQRAQKPTARRVIHIEYSPAVAFDD